MKDLLKKTIKTVPSIIIILGVFVISFIFVNNKMNSVSETKDVSVLDAQSATVNNIKNNNEINIKSGVAKKISQENNIKTTNLPFYYGVGAKGLTPLEVFKLIKVSEGNSIPFTVSFSPVDQVWYFAYPDSYPALSSIKDVNGFELISDFKVTTGNNIINASGEKITYRIYEYNNVTTLTSYKVTYL